MSFVSCCIPQEEETETPCPWQEESKCLTFWSSPQGSGETNLTSFHEDAGSIPGLDQWLKDAALLWLWYRLAATALIWPLAQELPYAMSAALKSKKKKKKTFLKTIYSTKIEKYDSLNLRFWLVSILLLMQIVGLKALYMCSWHWHQISHSLNLEQ